MSDQSKPPLKRFNNAVDSLHYVSYFVADPTIDPLQLVPDGRYSHVMQMQERLDFLRSLYSLYCYCCYKLILFTLKSCTISSQSVK